MNEFVQEKVLPPVMKFINFRPVQAIKDGMLFIMPISIVGSMFLLLAEFPYEPVKAFFANIGWSPAMYQANNATMGIMALVAVIAIPYSLAKSAGHEPLSAGISALVSFMLLLNWNIPHEAVEGGVGGIPTEWIGSQGVVASMIIGIVVGYIYVFFLDRDIRIRMSESVPSGVANSFNALIPIAVVALVSAVLYGVLNANGTSFLEIIYTTLQVPIQGLSGSLGMALFVPLIIHFLWWFGIHGATTVGGIVEPIFRANLAENSALYRAGELSLDNGAHVLTNINQAIFMTPTGSGLTFGIVIYMLFCSKSRQYRYLVKYSALYRDGELSLDNGAHVLTNINQAIFMTPTGSGLTFGIVIYMLFWAKSEQYSALGKLALGPALFNINEPIIFGTPIVMNPLLFIPFILIPTFGYVSSYFLIRGGILPLASGIEAPWTTPPILAGFISGGWKWAAYQAFLLVISVVGYFPFMRAADKQAYAQEQGLEGEEVVEAVQ